MKKYTTNNPEFSESIPIVEDGEFITSESANSAVIQLLNNELAILDMLLNHDAIDEAFYEIFEKNVQSDTQELSEEEINQLVSTEWD